MNLENIEASVISRLKNKYPSSMKTKYPDTNFTADDRVPAEPKFPTVYVHLMGSTEEGQDLEGLTINAVMATFQIEVKDNKSMNNASDVMGYVVKIMKTMRYEVVTMPEFSNNQSVYRKVARFRRMIGSGDVL